MKLWQYLRFAGMMFLANIIFAGSTAWVIGRWLRGPQGLFLFIPLIVAENVVFLWLRRRFGEWISALNLWYAYGFLMGLREVVKTHYWWGLVVLPIPLGFISLSYQTYRAKHAKLLLDHGPDSKIAVGE